MATYKCNSCGGTYSDILPDGLRYFHACSPDTIEPAIVDPAGKVTTPEKRTPRNNVRNENMLPFLRFEGGKYFRDGRDKNDPAIETHEEIADPVLSQGAGRTLVTP